MSKNKLLSSSLAYTIGNLLIQGLSFITLPIYTRVMTQEDYGNYNLYTSWVSIFTIFIGLQISGSFSIAKIKYEQDFVNYIRTSTSVATIFFVLFSIVSLIFHDFLENLLGFSIGILIFILLQGYFSHLQASLSQYYIQTQNTKKQLSLSFFMSFGNVVLSLIFLFTLKDDFLARILGGFIPSLVVAVVFLYFVYKNNRKLLEKSYIKFILVTSLPLVFHILGHSLLGQLDRIMIGDFMSSKEVAIYSFGYSLGSIVSIALMSMNTAWIPWFFAEKKKGDEELIKKYKERYLIIAVFLTIGFLSVFPELVTIMGSNDYKSSRDFVVLIVVSCFLTFLYTFPVNIQFFYENTKFIPIGTMFAAGINYVLNYILIPRQGIYGAAIATVASYLLLLVFHHIIAKVKYSYNEISILGYTKLTVVVCVYGVFTNYFIDNLLLRWSGCLIVFLILIFYYKKDIGELVKIIKKGEK
ncbi:oligosaccharide flippase family protein [Gemella morbillorum]|jgi:capsular polysaccharide repeating unit transporter cpsL|uniref:lipopolysaccharide biosynthesis protein n=1 Tax=Gemella morbillorum TaxID=29391 RepID=UPI0028D7CD14|nr:oligosaccharide flippase family protein [Gemella morbillorum]